MPRVACPNPTLPLCQQSTVVDELREQTGYNPRQRLVTAQRLMLVVVEAFLVGQTLGFTAMRAIFLRRFGFVRPCHFRSASSKPALLPSSGLRLSDWSIRSSLSSLTCAFTTASAARHLGLARTVLDMLNVATARWQDANDASLPRNSRLTRFVS